MKQENKNRKKSKMIVICIIFLLLLLIMTVAVYSYFLKNAKSNVEKQELLTALSQNDLKFFMNHELYSQIAERLENSDYNSDSNVTLSSTMENKMFSDLDLSKFEFNFNLTKDKEENKSYSQFTTKYASNHLLTLDFISTKTQFAWKSDEIVNRYIGINNKNRQSTLTKLVDKNIDYASFKKLKGFITQRENIDLTAIANEKGWEDYLKIFEKYVSLENISKKDNVIVTFDSDQVTTTEYTISFSKNDTADLMNEISQQIKNDNTIIPELVVTQIQNFEEDGEILEYTDNDNASTIQSKEETNNLPEENENDFIETQAEENNFETSIIIWDQNVIDGNSTIENQNTVSNTTNTQNVTNEIANSVQPSNQVLNETSTNTVENSVPVQNVVEELPYVNIEQPQNTQSQQNLVENSQQVPVTNQTVLEDENLRPQGFFFVNENMDYNADSDFLVGESLDETIDNIVQLSKKIDWQTYLLTGARANISQDELVAQFQQLLENEIEDVSSLVIKMYVSEGKLVKINFQIPETLKSFDIEIVSKNDNEKYLNLSVLKGKSSEANGYTVNLYKKLADANVKTNINVNKIYKSTIVQKTAINLETKGTLNAKKYTNHMSFSYLDGKGEFKLNVGNTLNFDMQEKNVELNDENSLFLDTLSEEDLNSVKEQIKEKALEVLGAKNRNLNIIDVNNSNSVVQQLDPPEVEESEQDRSVARDALVQTVADKMRAYLDAGTELKLQDLEGLEIPNHEVEISISSDLAMIKVDGYSFTLDAEFHLSDS